MAEEISAGEAAERATRQRRLLILSGPFAAGMLLGAYVAFRDWEGVFDSSTDWPPAIAAGLAAAFLLSVVLGSLFLRKQTDELERQISYKATSIASFYYFTVYPVWFLLWKGGLVPEPMHGPIFLGFWAILCLCYLYYRYR